MKKSTTPAPYIIHKKRMDRLQKLLSDKVNLRNIATHSTPKRRESFLMVPGSKKVLTKSPKAENQKGKRHVVTTMQTKSSTKVSWHEDLVIPDVNLTVTANSR